MSITWKYVKPTTMDKIEAVEKENAIKLPEDLQNLLIANNNGRPSPSTFDTKKSKERVFKKLLSYNKEDTENIYTAIEVLKKENSYLFPIASDPSGNFICLEKGEKIVLWLHEVNRTEFIAKSMTEFIEKLYQ